MSNRRADRLFQIVQLLRGGRKRTARELSDILGVSERTIYRDIDSLILDGMPIRGQAGEGYRMAETVFLPPLALTKQELEALHFGMRLVGQNGDPGLKRAAEEVLVKIGAVTPMARLEDRGKWLNVPVSSLADGSVQEKLRLAVTAKRKAFIRYQDQENSITERVVRPLQLEFWGRVWTCASWCEKRNDFRAFRLDRIVELELKEEFFEDEPGRRYEDYLAQIQEETAPTPRE